MHRSVHASFWLNSNGVRCLQLPAKSTKLNFIKNVWGFMARRVYNNRRKYDSIDQLKEALCELWQSLDSTHTRNLYHST